MIFRMHTMCKDQRRGGYLDITTIYIIYTKLYNKVLYLSTSNVTVAALTPLRHEDLLNSARYMTTL